MGSGLLVRMTPWAADLDQCDTWEDLEDRLHSCSRVLTVIVGRDGPVVCLDVSGWLGGSLRVTDPRDQLRAQDRRRLHRLGLRPCADTPPGALAHCWTWQSSPVELPLGAPVGELVVARLQAGSQVAEACRDQLLAVLREGLRLDPSQLTVLPVEEEREEDDWDGDDDDWSDVG